MVPRISVLGTKGASKKFQQEMKTRTCSCDETIRQSPLNAQSDPCEKYFWCEIVNIKRVTTLMLKTIHSHEMIREQNIVPLKLI